MSERIEKTKRNKTFKCRSAKDSTSQPRIGWAKAFKKMHAKGQDNLLIPDIFEDEEF